MSRAFLAAAFGMLVLWPSPRAVRAADTAGLCRASAGPTLQPLVELYTSEGCSSCPPADRWLSATWPAAAEGAPGIALAFHVDYWDRLGWPDRHASAEWSRRQRELARALRSGVVYTPQVVVRGEDFPDWRNAGTRSMIARAATETARAEVSIQVDRVEAGVRARAEGRARGGRDAGPMRIVLAYKDGGHVTEVRRGENAGVRLVHDHVVRALASGQAVDPASSMRAELTVGPLPQPGADPAFVAFVERTDTREVLQAVELPLARCPPAVARPRG